MSTVKFIALFDLHIGKERGLRRGRWTTINCNAREATKNVIRFAQDFAPDVVVYGGDQLQVGSVSHWTKGVPMFTEDLRLKEDYETLYSEVLEPLAPIKRKIWHDGNHEAWANAFVAANPGVAGLVEPHEYLKLQDTGYELYSSGEVSHIGKLNFVHGDTVLGKGSGVNPARTLVNAYRRNIRCGHIHTYSAAIEVTAVDAKDFHSGVVVPSLSTRTPFYIKNNPNCFMQGFLYGYVYSDGSFSDFVTIINDDTFTVNGIKYGTRRR
jgi:hypothetical protein